MTDTTAPAAKWWGNSLTIRGAILSAASAALPIVSTIVGIEIKGETIRQIGEHTGAVVQAVGGLAGLVMTVVGRSRATAPLERRAFRVKL
jgi:hypothetical protein